MTTLEASSRMTSRRVGAGGPGEAPTGARPSALFVSADLPWPPDGGGRIASLRVLEAIAARFEVDLVALADTTADVDLGHLEQLCRSMTIVRHPFTFGRHRLRQGVVALRSLASTDPYRIRKFRSRNLGREIARRMRDHRYDLVHFEQLGVAGYRRPGIPSTLTTQNVESEIYRLGSTRARDALRRAWAFIEAAKLRRVEPRMLRGFDRVFVLCAEDAALLEREGIRDVTVIPMPAPAIDPPRAEVPPEPLLVSLGSMSWFGVEDGLLWFARDVLPLIRRSVPGVHWRLVGSNAGPAVTRLAEDAGIDVVGYVSDVRQALRDARVGIIPLHIAGGVRMKLLDLMAWGIPSVATSAGARGIDFDDGSGCFRRDDPGAFASAVVDLLLDDGLWTRTVASGRAYVSAHRSLETFNAAVDTGIGQAVAHFAERGHAVR